MSADQSTATDLGTAAAGKWQHVLKDYQDVFPDDIPAGLPPHRGTGHVITLEQGTRPVFRPMFRFSPGELQEIQKQVAGLLQKRFIEPSTSPFGSPVLFMRKKEGGLRMCVDYRALNDKTVNNRYPLPRNDELLDRLQGAKCLTTLDLISGYHQIRISDEDVPKTAFRTHQGSYQYKVIAFGLANAPSTFQQVMNDVFRDMSKFVLVYLDDILIFSKDEEQHASHLQRVLQRLREHRLFARLAKCKFAQARLPYLGHIVGADGIQVDPTKTAAVDTWPVPKSVADLQRFLGFCNYSNRTMPRR